MSMAKVLIEIMVFRSIMVEISWHPSRRCLRMICKRFGKRYLVVRMGQLRVRCKWELGIIVTNLFIVVLYIDVDQLETDPVNYGMLIQFIL